MNPLSLFLTVSSVICLSGCAQTHESETTPPAQKSETPNKAPVAQTAAQQTAAKRGDELPYSTGEEMSSQKNEMIMTSENKDYWVKRVGTAVYNGEQLAVRSLRFQPKVTVLKEVEGWGLIDAAKDEWVKMSDLTTTKPEGLLERPENSTGGPKLTPEEMMKLTGNK